MKSRLHAFAYSDPVRRWIDPYECGWHDGGCFIFAVALCLWLAPEAEPAALYRTSLKDEQTADHWVCHIGGHFLDADGVYNASSLVNRWSQHPGVREAVILELPADPVRAVTVLKKPNISRMIASLLEARFGQPKVVELPRVLGQGAEGLVRTSSECC